MRYRSLSESGYYISCDKLVFQQVVEEIVQVVVQALHQVATHYHGVVICQIELAQILLVVILQHKTVWLQNAR